MPALFAARPADDAAIVGARLLVPLLTRAFRSRFWRRSCWTGSTASFVLTDDRDFQLGAACFFAFLIMLIIWLYDVFKPVYDVRFINLPLRVASPGAFARPVRGAETHDGAAMP